jgi:dual specificity tyrosine-phosphorylation-regulated kinase 2/3/4
MDVAATRYQPRNRAQSYLDRENGTPATEDSGPECKPVTSMLAKGYNNGALTSKTAESQTRRKFQRTAANPEDGEGFRKPSIPASATRRPVVDRRPSDSASARRRSTHLREGMRVPSGPREFPGGSPGKRYARTWLRNTGKEEHICLQNKQVRP